MYEYIKGVFIGINKDYLVVENNGIGYRIYTSGSTIAKMPKTGECVQLYLEQIVREDFIGLYGFLSKDEINMFNLLITVSGVGAKAALSLLSICSVNNLKYSILSGDDVNLIRAPGIGKKIAQRLILELKDKLSAEQLLENVNDDGVLSNNENCSTEALAALIALGYSEKEAKKALSNVSKEDTVENIIKSCLKYLMN